MLAFLLGNTILAKSPKAMLRGWRGFLVYAVAFALFFTVWSADVFHTIERVPDADRVTSAEIRISRIDADTEITDRETLEALCTLLENQIAADRAGGINRRGGDSLGFYVETVLHTKWGIPVARNYYVRKTTVGAQAFLRAYADSGAMDVFFTCGDTLAEAGVDVTVQVEIGDETAKTSFAFADLWQIYRREFGAMSYERLSSSPVGTVSIWDMNADGDMTFYDMHWSMWSTLPIYADMEDTLAFLRDTMAADGAIFTDDGGVIIGATVLYTGGGMLDGALAEKGNEMAEAAESYSASGSAVTIADVDLRTYDYPSIELTAAEAEALLPHLACGDAAISSVFLDIDTEYYVILRTAHPVNREDQEKYGVETTEREMRCDFIAGSVPESIKVRFK